MTLFAASDDSNPKLETDDGNSLLAAYANLTSGGVGDKWTAQAIRERNVRQFNYALERSVTNQPEDKARYGALLFGEGAGVQVLVNHTGVHAGPIFLQSFYDALLAADGASSSTERGRVYAELNTLPLITAEKQERLNFESFAIAFNI